MGTVTVILDLMVHYVINVQMDLQITQIALLLGKQDFVLMLTHVKLMREIVKMITNVRVVFCVEIVMYHLDLTQLLIVVVNS